MPIGIFIFDFIEAPFNPIEIPFSVGSPLNIIHKGCVNQFKNMVL
jgi:hypothetical protein